MKPSGPVFDRAWRGRCRIERLDRARVEPMVKAHYLGKFPGVCVLILGLLLDGQPAGVIIFALPPRETAKRYGSVTWELARLWVADEMPQNTETYLISQAVKVIRRERPDVGMLVSYADPSAGHAGTIYKAANWVADGKTDDGRKTPRCDYADKRTGKRYSRRSHVPADAEIVRVPRVSKHRFTYQLRNKK
jgi:hypothetical protein